MWHLHESNFTVIAQATILYNVFENLLYFSIYFHISQKPMSSELNHTFKHMHRT